MDENIVLRVTNVRKSYWTRGKSGRELFEAVRGVSFSVRRGEVYGIVGENGAGKSTVVECALGVRAPDAGSVELLEMNPVCAPRKVKRTLFNRVGVQFQMTAFQNKIRVGEACETAACLYDDPADWRELLALFGLADALNRETSVLSGGEKQKLAVVLALVPRPEIVFLDELTTGLDPKARRSIWNLLKRFQADGLTVVLTSHYMDEIEYLCDRVAVMKAGRLETEGTPYELTAAHGAKNLEEVFLAYTDGVAVQDGEICTMTGGEK